MKRILLGLALLASAACALAQVQPTQFVQQQALVSATAASGPASAVRNAAANKTYQVVGSVSAGTGSVAISVEGSNTGANWDTVWSTTLSLNSSTTAISTSTSSVDRYLWVRSNITAISGTLPAISAFFGF